MPLARSPVPSGPSSVKKAPNKENVVKQNQLQKKSDKGGKAPAGSKDSKDLFAKKGLKRTPPPAKKAVQTFGGAGGGMKRTPPAAKKAQPNAAKALVQPFGGKGGALKRTPPPAKQQQPKPQPVQHHYIPQVQQFGAGGGGVKRTPPPAKQQTQQQVHPQLAQPFNAPLQQQPVQQPSQQQFQQQRLQQPQAWTSQQQQPQPQQQQQQHSQPPPPPQQQRLQQPLQQQQQCFQQTQNFQYPQSKQLFQPSQQPSYQPQQVYQNWSYSGANVPQQQHQMSGTAQQNIQQTKFPQPVQYSAPQPQLTSFQQPYAPSNINRFSQQFTIQQEQQQQQQQYLPQYNATAQFGPGSTMSQPMARVPVPSAFQATVQAPQNYPQQMFQPPPKQAAPSKVWQQPPPATGEPSMAPQPSQFQVPKPSEEPAPVGAEQVTVAFQRTRDLPRTPPQEDQAPSKEPAAKKSLSSSFDSRALAELLQSTQGTGDLAEAERVAQLAIAIASDIVAGKQTPLEVVDVAAHDLSVPVVVRSQAPTEPPRSILKHREVTPVEVTTAPAPQPGAWSPVYAAAPSADAHASIAAAAPATALVSTAPVPMAPVAVSRETPVVEEPRGPSPKGTDPAVTAPLASVAVADVPVMARAAPASPPCTTTTTTTTAAVEQAVAVTTPTTAPRTTPRRCKTTPGILRVTTPPARVPVSEAVPQPLTEQATCPQGVCTASIALPLPSPVPKNAFDALLSKSALATAGVVTKEAPSAPAPTAVVETPAKAEAHAPPKRLTRSGTKAAFDALLSKKVRGATSARRETPTEEDVPAPPADHESEAREKRKSRAKEQGNEFGNDFRFEVVRKGHNEGKERENGREQRADKGHRKHVAGDFEFQVIKKKSSRDEGEKRRVERNEKVVAGDFAFEVIREKKRPMSEEEQYKLEKKMRREERERKLEKRERRHKEHKERRSEKSSVSSAPREEQETRQGKTASRPASSSSLASLKDGSSQPVAATSLSSLSSLSSLLAKPVAKKAAASVDYAGLTFRELQLACKEAGLKAMGKKVELVASLEKWQLTAGRS